MRAMFRARALAAATLVLLTGCAQAQVEREARQAEVDPAVARALMAPLLSDPDLMSLDSSSLDGSLPPDDFAPTTIEAAREEARRLVAGGNPAPLATGGVCP